LYLNVAGREPQGSVKPGEDYEQKRADLRNQLSLAKDQETGKLLFSHIYYREEIYQGVYLSLGPDLILVPGDISWNLGGAVGKTVVDRPVVSGKHHPDGVFIAYGAGVIAQQHCNASIYEITPTILQALGVAVPDDGEAPPQIGWFNLESKIAQRAVQRAYYPDISLSGYEWTAQEEQQVEGRLRDLGYLD
jgi:predicted AlkP superfamily phosphohydrolase/phosphomutase